MEYAVGVGLALLVAVFAAWGGLDRDRAFYPTVLVVIASYYDLFAVIGGSPQALGLETLMLAAFAGAALVGFKKNLWIVALALFAHGALDLAHGHLIANPGVPGGWPMFCMAYDWTAAACLAWRLAAPGPEGRAAGTDPRAPEGFRSRISAHVAAELQAARRAEQSGDPAASFRHLERAHVLGQASTVEHVRTHLRMLGWAWRRRDVREMLAQILRIGGGATMTLFGLVPAGNTGGGDIGPFRTLAVPGDLAAPIAAANPPVIGRGVGLLLAIGFLFSCVMAVRAVTAGF